MVRGGALWHEVLVLETVDSTNSVVAERARAGAPEGFVVVAEEQSAGRGRLDRTWSAPPRAAVLLSALLRPRGVATSAWPLVGLLTGLAVVEALGAVARVDAVLKWPNDVLVEGSKLGGILVERVDGALVVGIGINVSTRSDELPVDTATSLALAGGSTDREMIVKELLRALDRRYAAWIDRGGVSSSVVPAYREHCETIGLQVELRLPGGDVVRGLASDVDDNGHLVVREAGGAVRSWQAGDVTHVRKAH